MFLEFIDIVSIFYYISMEFAILLYTFLVISFAWYKEYMICPISFNNFSDVSPACTSAVAIDSLWRICLGVNISRRLQSKSLAMPAKSEGRPFPFCCLLMWGTSSAISFPLSGCLFSGFPFLFPFY